MERHVGGDWTLVLAEYVDTSNTVVWDVFLTHPNAPFGRMPAGETRYDGIEAAEREAARLVKLVDWP